MTGPPADDDLVASTEELVGVLRDLRDELRGSPRRGPLGLPAPPSPRRALAFADAVAIPATIAVLEATIELLEALRRGIRLAEGDRDAARRGRTVEEGAADLGRTALDRLDGVLADLRTAVERGEPGEDHPAADLLARARELREEVAAELSAAEKRTATHSGGEGTDDADREVPVDVEGELESLKREYGDPDEGDADGSGGAADGDGTGEAAGGDTSDGSDGGSDDGT